MPSVHGYTPVDIAGFCGKQEAVKFIAYTLAFKILKEQTMIERGEYDIWYNGHYDFHHNKQLCGDL